MALPLPNVVADVGPGGPLVSSMRGINALQDAMLANQIKKIEAQYAPVTVPAEAASKLAYANLMGPQFLAKLMGNPDILANFTPGQQAQALNTVYSAGSGRGTGANAFTNLATNPPQPQSNSLAGWLVNQFKNMFGSSSQNAPQQSANPFAQQPNLSAVDRNAINNMQPGQSYTIQGNQGQGADSGYAYDRNGNNVVATPAEANAAANQGQVIAQNTFAENAGRYRGIIKAGEELGTKRGEAISDLGKQQLDLSNSGVVLDRLKGIIQNPEFQKMRNQIPYFQDKQLWYLSKNGTPEQQKSIGDFISTLQAFKSSTVNSFRGKALEKEFDLADKIKIDENDTMGVTLGKLQSLETLKQIAETKNDMILDLMTNKNMNEGEAIRIANKSIKTQDIEKQVDSVLNPQPTEKDIQYMMKKRNISRDQVIKSLKQKGYKNVS